MKEITITKDGQLIALITDSITVVKKGYEIQTTSTKNDRATQIQLLLYKIDEINKIIQTLKSESGFER